MTVVRMLSTVANVTTVSPHADWRDDSVLLGELAALNTRIARYITHMLDADATRGEPIKPADEAALGRALVELGERLLERSGRQPAAGATTTGQAPLPRDGQAHGPTRLPRRPEAPPPRLPHGARTDQPAGGEVIDMDETSNTLVVGVTTTPIVQDRTEIQLSDGMDDGETRDPT